MLNNGPSLISPNGGEIFTDNKIEITWFEPSDIEDSTDFIFYEILMVEDYKKFSKNEWLQIATVPKGTISFTWNVSPFVKSTKCRIGIRAVNHKGERSEISFSADNFSIRDKHLPVPAVLEPVSGRNYFSSIPIIIDYSGIINQSSERAFYQVFYKSDSLNIDWTLIEGNMHVGSDPIFWDVRELKTADDYVLRVELTDQDITSNPLFINNLKINNFNFFLLDTVPPKGAINIINNTRFVKERNLVLKLDAFDETTAVRDVRVEQEDIDKNDNPSPGPYLPMSDTSTYRIKDPLIEGNADGVKLVEARYRDYGNNIIVANDSDFFRTYESLNNNKVTAFLTVQNAEDFTKYDKWTAFAGSPPQLYKNNGFIAELEYEATALESFDDIIYVAVKKDGNTGILQRIIGSTVETVATISEDDSIINSMAVFDSKLFLGLNNGRLKSFSGATIKTENQDNLFSSAILKIESNRSSLFVFFDSSENIVILSINEFGDNIYNTIVITS